MQVYLDGQLIDDAGTTLGRAIDSARARAAGRMIVQATADGTPVPACDLDEPPSRSPYAAAVEFASADPRALLNQTLNDAADLLAEVRDRQAAASALLQSGKVEEAVLAVGTVLECWSTVRDALTLVVRAAPAECYDGVEREELSAAVESLARGLGEIKRSMSMEDWASLSDLLGWDMPECAERLRSWLLRAASR